MSIAAAGSVSSIRGMVRIPGGTFLMGSAGLYPEERPVHSVTVDGIDPQREAEALMARE